MKFAEEIFPKGSFIKQQTDGAYIHGMLGPNLDIFAKKIIEDMHFCLLVSGHDAVGNGKTTIATQMASYLTYQINKQHNINNTFTVDNIVFKTDDLIKKSFELPKHSIILLDEGDDLTTHGMKELAVKLKRYFRKCRQLNQILILILPSFFELPKFYALSRTHALIDVMFFGEFERGRFNFYGMKKKKELYIKGKQFWDYDVVKPDFFGDFFSSYCFFPNLKENIEAYKQKKYQDMLDDSKEQKKLLSLNEVRQQVKIEMFNQFYPYSRGKFTQEELAAAFDVSRRTIISWVNDYTLVNSDGRATDSNKIVQRKVRERRGIKVQMN